MNIWQQVVIIVYAVLACVTFLRAYFEITTKKNTFGLANWLLPLGIFVWGDGIILGPFWILVAIGSLLANSWYLFLLSIALFWVVRSLGEIQYWLHEQFATQHRNPLKTLLFYPIVKNEAVWFLYQLVWQCILVISLIASLYIAKLWLQS